MQRPTSVSVIAILNFVFGGLGLCGQILTVIGLLVASAGAAAQPGGFPNPTIDAVEKFPVYKAYSFLSTGMGFLASILLIACGIGLLQMRPWARMGSLLYAIYAIVMALVHIVASVVYVLPGALEAAKTLPREAAAGFQVGFVFGLAGVTLYSISLPVAILIVLTRPKVVVAFEADSPYGIDYR